MTLREEHPPGSRLRVVPPVSCRTLQHPSLLPLYLAAGLARHHGGWDHHTVHAITPEEFHYTDPTMSCGTRIPNMLTDFGFYDCFQLNTPPPLMSSFVKSSNSPDPFSLGPHPTRELGSLDWNMNPNHLPVKTSRAIIQLTPDEDVAVNSLLKLRYRESGSDDETPTKEVHQPSSGDGTHQSQEDLGNKPQVGKWSEAELEAADTLLNLYSCAKDEIICAQCLEKTSATPSDPPPQQDVELSNQTKTLAALRAFLSKSHWIQT